MRLTEQDIDIIDAYLAGELNGEALMSFELRLAGDAEFADEVGMIEALALGAKRSVLEEKMRLLQEVDSQQAIVDSSVEEKDTSFDRGPSTSDPRTDTGVVDSQQSMVDSVLEEKDTSIEPGQSKVDQKGKVRGLWKLLAAAASIAVIGMVFLMQMGNDELNVIPFPDTMRVRSVEKNQLTEAMSAYAKEDYATAFELLNGIDGEILSSVSSEVSLKDIAFYQSMSALMLGKYDDAELYLSNSEGERYPTSYYQGIIDLKRGNEISDLKRFCECENCPSFLLSDIAKYCSN